MASPFCLEGAEGVADRGLADVELGGEVADAAGSLVGELFEDLELEEGEVVAGGELLAGGAECAAEAFGGGEELAVERGGFGHGCILPDVQVTSGRGRRAGPRG